MKKKGICLGLVMIFLVIFCGGAYAKEQYSLDDFQIGYLYRTDTGRYYSDEAYEYAEKQDSLGGLCFEETDRRFPGGNHVYMDDPYILETAGIIWKNHYKLTEQDFVFPVFSYWKIMDGRTLVMVWQRNDFDVIEPYGVYVYEKFPTIEEFRALKKNELFVDDVKEINPFWIDYFIANGLNYYIGRSLWLDGDKLKWYFHVYTLDEKKIIMSFRDRSSEKKLRDFGQVVADLLN